MGAVIVHWHQEHWFVPLVGQLGTDLLDGTSRSPSTVIYEKPSLPFTEASHLVQWWQVSASVQRTEAYPDHFPILVSFSKFQPQSEV